MVFDGVLTGMGDQDYLIDPGGYRLVDHVLDQGSIDYGQHLLGDRLGCRKHASAETRDGNNGLANFVLFHPNPSWLRKMPFYSNKNALKSQEI